MVLWTHNTKPSQFPEILEAFKIARYSSGSPNVRTIAGKRRRTHTILTLYGTNPSVEISGKASPGRILV